MALSTRLTVACAFAAMSTTVLAHDTETPYSTRGECERALAAINNSDRAESKPFRKEFGFTYGDANRYFHLRFSCQSRDGLWYIVDHRPEDGQ